MKRTGTFAIALVAITTGTLLGGCKKTIDPDSIESTIEKMLLEKGITVKATCPEGQKPEPGTTFNCTAVEAGAAAGATPLEFKVDLQDTEGKFFVKLVGSIVEAAKIEANVKERDPNATAKCPWKVKAMKLNETVMCELSGVEGMKQLKVTMTDIEAGTVKYDPMP